MGTLGILLDGRVFGGIKKKKTGNEHLHLYNKAAAKHGLSLVYLNLNHITPPSNRSLSYRWGKGKYVLGRHRIPSVIHNRAMAFSATSKKRMAWLNKTRFVFNAKTRYSKYEIYNHLKARFASHLPATVRYSKNRLQRMMERHAGLFVKPVSGSVGEGIMQLTKLDSGSWKLKGRGRAVTAKPKAIRSLVHRAIGHKRYLIQQAIPLAKYKGKPYDIRVTVQRGADGDWQVVGMFGKVAKRGSGVTNVARGGSVKSVDVLFRNHFPYPSYVSANVKQFALAVTRHLGSKLKNLADVGLDIGIDDMGKPYLIEMNGRDQRYGFKKAGMAQAFQKTYENPVSYGYFMLRSKKK